MISQGREGQGYQEGDQLNENILKKGVYGELQEFTHGTLVFWDHLGRFPLQPGGQVEAQDTGEQGNGENRVTSPDHRFNQ